MPIPNTCTGSDRFLRTLQSMCGSDPQTVTFCMEVTGHYWLALYEFLTYKGYVVHVVNPIQSYGA